MELKQLIRAQWDRILAGLLTVTGLLALLIGHLGVSDETLPAAQIPYVISGGVVGVVLIGIGTAVWFSADLRDEWRKLDRLEEVALALLDGRDPEELERQTRSDEEEGAADEGSAVTSVDSRSSNGSRPRIPTGGRRIPLRAPENTR